MADIPACPLCGAAPETESTRVRCYVEDCLLCGVWMPEDAWRALPRRCNDAEKRVERYHAAVLARERCENVAEAVGDTYGRETDIFDKACKAVDAADVEKRDSCAAVLSAMVVPTTPKVPQSVKSLIAALGKAQGLFGRARGIYENDRNPERANEVIAALNEGFELCVAALSKHPPEESPPPVPAAPEDADALIERYTELVCIGATECVINDAKPDWCKGHKQPIADCRAPREEARATLKARIQPAPAPTHRPEHEQGRHDAGLPQELRHSFAGYVHPVQSPAAPVPPENPDADDGKICCQCAGKPGSNPSRCFACGYKVVKSERDALRAALSRRPVTAEALFPLLQKHGAPMDHVEGVDDAVEVTQANVADALRELEKTL